MLMYQSSHWTFNNRRIGKRSLRSLLPRRCFLSGKNIWMKKSTVVYTMITGPGTPIFDNYWCDPNEFLLYELRK
jgi:hypothetical protein